MKLRFYDCIIEIKINYTTLFGPRSVNENKHKLTMAHPFANSNSSLDGIS